MDSTPCGLQTSIGSPHRGPRNGRVSEEVLAGILRGGEAAHHLPALQNTRSDHVIPLSAVLGTCSGSEHGGSEDARLCIVCSCNKHTRGHQNGPLRVRPRQRSRLCRRLRHLFSSFCLSKAGLHVALFPPCFSVNHASVTRQACARLEIGLAFIFPAQAGGLIIHSFPSAVLHPAAQAPCLARSLLRPLARLPSRKGFAFEAG